MLDFLKGKRKGNCIGSPCKGKAVALTEVPDPTFSVTLKGAPFTAHVAAGDHVKKGNLLLDADLEKIQEAGLHIITPVLVCNTDEYNKISILKEGEVSPGEDVLQISFS